MGDSRGAVPDRRDFTLRQMDPVAKICAGPREPETLIHAEIVRRVRAQRCDPGNLVMVFRQMRLHRASRVLRPEQTRGIELFSRRGRREARRDRIFEPGLPVPFPDQPLRSVIAGFCRVAEFGRGVAVHHDLARRHA